MGIFSTAINVRSLIVVGASDTPYKLKARADYICTGTRTTGGDQDTINMALQEGKAVLLLPGTYWLSGSIVLDSNQMLIGSGMSTVVKLRDNHNADISLIYVEGKSGVVIRDLVMDGNKENQSSGANYGIVFATVTDSKILFCKILNLRNRAITVDVNCSNISIIGNTCSNCNEHGIVVANTEKSVVFGNLVENVAWFGIYLYQSNRNVIKSNICRNNGNHGIVLDISSYNHIVENIAFDNGYDGIRIHGYCNNNVVSNNIVCGNNQNNIIVDIHTNNNNLIIGNVCRHNDRSAYGIRIAGSNCNYNVIHGNDLYQSGLDGDIYDAGTNTRKRDNIGNDGAWLTDA